MDIAAEKGPALTLDILMKVNSFKRHGTFYPLEGGPVPNYPLVLDPIV
jgi:hypothetical protein